MRAAMQFLARITILPGLCMAGVCCAAEESRLETLRRSVARELERQGVVGAALGVVEDGKIVAVQTFGFADREKEIPVTEETLFNWAANSMPLTAVLAMQLAEEDRLDLDADIRSYFPGYPEQDFPVTLRVLLGHRSGLPSFGDRIVKQARRISPEERGNFSPQEAVELFSASPLLFRPGAKYYSSPYGYILASAVLERASGQSFDLLVQEKIARATGMRSLQLDRPAPPGLETHDASAYARRNGAVRKLDKNFHAWKSGAGGYKSNIRDFTIFAKALLNGRLLSPESGEEMWLQSPQDDDEEKARRYPLGFRIRGDGDGRRISQNGAQDGARTRLVLYPGQNRALVIMSNSNHTDRDALERVALKALGQTMTEH